LKNISMPDSVLKIGCFAFSGCTGLPSIFIPKSVFKITHLWEKGCGEWHPLNFSNGIEVHPDNPKFSSEDGVLFDKNKTVLIRYPDQRKGHYNIPCSVVEIGREAFSYCIGLTSVNIPSSVVKIGYESFRDCIGLTSVNIPDSVVEIESSAFMNCIGLTAVTIPDSVVTIESDAFLLCSLTSVSIPKSVVKNEYSALNDSFEVL